MVMAGLNKRRYCHNLHLQQKHNCLGQIFVRDTMLGGTNRRAPHYGIIPVYWRVYRSECKRRTHLERIFVSYLPARDTVLGNDHRINILARDSSLCIPLLVIAILQVWEETTNVLRANFCKLLIDAMLGRVHHMNSYVFQEWLTYLEQIFEIPSPSELWDTMAFIIRTYRPVPPHYAATVWTIYWRSECNQRTQIFVRYPPHDWGGGRSLLIMHVNLTLAILVAALVRV